MNILPRFFALFAFALIATPAAGWLILVCADFLSLADCLIPQPGWLVFALISSLSLVLPPALHAWPDSARSLRYIVQETGRTVLFSFSIFALFFLAAARPLFQWLNIPVMLLPLAMANLAQLFSCPLLYISYKIGTHLLPRSGPPTPRPPSMHLFGVFSLLLVLALIVQPFFFPLAERLDLLAAAWRYLALRYVLSSCGNAGFVPAWGGCCLISLLDLLPAMPEAEAAQIAAAAVIFTLMLASCACLLLPSSRRWLC